MVNEIIEWIICILSIIMMIVLGILFIRLLVASNHLKTGIETLTDTVSPKEKRSRINYQTAVVLFFALLLLFLSTFALWLVPTDTTLFALSIIVTFLGAFVFPIIVLALGKLQTVS